MATYGRRRGDAPPRAAQSFSAARSSVSRRFSPRSGSIVAGADDPRVQRRQPAHRLLRLLVVPGPGWVGDARLALGQRFQPRRVDQVDDVADDRHPVALAPEADQPRRVAGEVEDRGSRPPRRPRSPCRRSSRRRRPSAAAGSGRSSAPAPPAAARGRCRARSRRRFRRRRLRPGGSRPARRGRARCRGGRRGRGRGRSA